MRKLALTAHVVASIGWLGALAAFLALAVAGLTSSGAQMVRAAYLAMEAVTRFVILPFALVTLLTGLVSSLSSPWGLFRHYWVLTKLVLTVLATIVLLLQVAPVSDLASAAAATTLAGTDLREARLSVVVHAGGGLLVLLVPTVLGVYKPQGMTPHGQRKHNAQRRTARP